MQQLHQLIALSAVAEHRSFRGAAQALKLSPSAVSHAVAALERKLRVRLFQRTTRSVSLTLAGQRFLSRVRPALREISSAMDELGEVRDKPAGTLRVAASEDAFEDAALAIWPLVRELRRAWPEVQVDLASAARPLDLAAEGFDCGVTTADAIPDEMAFVRCTGKVRFAVVGSKAYFKTRQKPRSPEDLTAHDCIRRRLAAGGLQPWEFEKNGRKHEVAVKGSLTLMSEELVLRAAREGLGLAYVSEARVAEDVAAGRLVGVLGSSTTMSPGYCIYHPKRRHLPAALRAFLELAKVKR